MSTEKKITQFKIRRHDLMSIQGKKKREKQLSISKQCDVASKNEYK